MAVTAVQGHTMLGQQVAATVIRMVGACAIWQVMSGNGVRTGITTITRTHRMMVQLGYRLRAPSGSAVAAAGSTAPGTADRRIAAATTRGPGAATWAFALRGRNKCKSKKV